MDNLLQNKRIQWIDALKGIGIIIVILGHTPISPNLRSFIFSFHMPLFFMISGFLFSIDNNTKFLPFLVKKMKSLLIPYIFFFTLSVLIKILFSNGDISFSHTFITFIESKRISLDYNTPLWFLTSLFVVEILFYFMVKYIKKLWFIVPICLIIGCYGLKLPDLPWSLNYSLHYLAFYSIGYMLKSVDFIKRSPRFIVVSLICCVLSIFIYLRPAWFSNVFNYLSWLPFGLSTYLQIYIIALTCIFALIPLAKIFESSIVLNRIGGNSLIILGLHVVILNIISLIYVFLNLSTRLENFYGIVMTVITLILIKPVCYLINNYTPFILGKFNTGVLNRKRSDSSKVK